MIWTTPLLKLAHGEKWVRSSERNHYQAAGWLCREELAKWWELDPSPHRLVMRVSDVKPKGASGFAYRFKRRDLGVMLVTRAGRRVWVPVYLALESWLSKSGVSEGWMWVDVADS